MNAAIKRNAQLRRHGRGIFEGDAGLPISARDNREKLTLPVAPPHIRAAFKEEAAEHKRKERRKWVFTVGILLLLPYAFKYLPAILEILEALLWPH